jgi:cytochrome c oxidase subunit 3
MPQDGQVPNYDPKNPASARRRPAVPSAVLATLIFVATEAMFFTGFISAFVIVKAGIKPGMWPPPWQPRLPVEATAFNTAVLVVSGVLMLLAGLSRFRKTDTASRALYLAAAAGGAFFVIFQGVEWSRLIGEGLTMRSSNHGAFFYLIVGTHALHVVGGITAVLWGAVRLQRGLLTRPQLAAIQIFWTFVVGLWPILYTLVYL